MNKKKKKVPLFKKKYYIYYVMLFGDITFVSNNAWEGWPPVDSFKVHPVPYVRVYLLF